MSTSNAEVEEFVGKDFATPWDGSDLGSAFADDTFGPDAAEAFHMALALHAQSFEFL